MVTPPTMQDIDEAMAVLAGLRLSLKVPRGPHTSPIGVLSLCARVHVCPAHPAHVLCGSYSGSESVILLCVGSFSACWGPKRWQYNRCWRSTEGEPDLFGQRAADA